NHLVPIPDGIEDHVAAPILCAGLTVYRGLKLSNTKLGDWVVIPGAGGGLGHLVVLRTSVIPDIPEFRLYLLDSGEVKKSVCLGLGAEKWVDFKHSTDVVKDVVEACDGLGPHAALIIPPIGAAYDDALQYLRTSGTLVMIGLPDNSFKLKTPVVHLIRKVGRDFLTMQDAIEALDLVARKKVTPHVQLGRLVDMNKIFDELHAGRIVGRTVVKL
ncbi:mannitol-1-phosphate dehydrogenase-like protein, partial [Amylostereum chailletii]